MSFPPLRFAEGTLGDSLRAQERKLEQAAQSIPADRASATSAEALAASLVEEYRVEPIVLDEAAMTGSHKDERVDVGRDPMRMILDRSQPFYIPGTNVTLHVPFSGEADLFKMRASTFTLNPPRGTVTGHELLISMTVPAPAPATIGDQLKCELAKVKTHIDWVNAEVREYNDRLPGVAMAAATRRREKVIADHDLVASLGIPVRRTDAPMTYAAPPVRKTVSQPASAGKPGAPLEPSLPAADYEQIIGIVRQMSLVLERSPKAFAGMGEEDLRQHFLVQLNGQYEGDATGETFNFEGKTDILIRRGAWNIFIAECKFWDGPKILSATIDQLLGYLSWRDTKAAIFLFNRGGKLTAVLEKIRPTVAAHPAYVREISYGGETDFRFVLRHRDDPERELTVTILVFEVPG